jgi:hypothetical protein
MLSIEEEQHKDEIIELTDKEGEEEHQHAEEEEMPYIT